MYEVGLRMNGAELQMDERPPRALRLDMNWLTAEQHQREWDSIILIPAYKEST
jgi:hypothetical protein